MRTIRENPRSSLISDLACAIANPKNSPDKLLTWSLSPQRRSSLGPNWANRLNFEWVNRHVAHPRQTNKTPRSGGTAAIRTFLHRDDLHAPLLRTSRKFTRTSRSGRTWCNSDARVCRTLGVGWPLTGSCTPHRGIEINLRVEICFRNMSRAICLIKPPLGYSWRGWK